MLPGNLLLVLFKETKNERYRKALEAIRQRFDTYPCTEDGAFWHALSRQHQLWLDGMYMSMPFLVRYGKAFAEEKYTSDEAVKQLLIYAKHLNDPSSGLLFMPTTNRGSNSGLTRSRTTLRSSGVVRSDGTAWPSLKFWRCFLTITLKGKISSRWFASLRLLMENTRTRPQASDTELSTAST